MKTKNLAKAESLVIHDVRWRIWRSLPIVALFLLVPHLSLAQVPLIQQLSPPAVAANGSDVTLTVYGANFISGSKVNFNGSGLTTTFVSANKLTAMVPGTDTGTAGTAVITVSNPAITLCVLLFGCPPNPPITLVPASGSNSVFFPIFTGPTTVSFAALPSHGLGPGAGPTSIAVGDFNGDGKQDLVVTDSANDAIHVLLGNGDGTFADSGPISTGHNPQGLAVGDFNGDGKLDVAVVNTNDSNVQIFLGDGTGSFQAPAKTYGLQSGIGPVAVVAVDLDGDGILDLAVVNQLDHSTCGGMSGKGSLSFLKGNGDGTFTTFSTSTFVPPNIVLSSALNPVCVDVPASQIVAGLFNLSKVNGAGLPDLVVNNGDFVSGGCPLGDGMVTVLTNQFVTPPATSTQTSAGLAFGTQSFCVGKTPSGLAVGDFNNDGKLDLAVADFGDNAVTILIGNGDGTFGAAPNSYKVNGLGPTAIAVGDFNSDGNDDLAVADQGSSGVTVLQGGGDGTFAPASGSPFTTLDASSTGHGPVALVAADFNGDGRLDVASADDGDGNVSTLLQGIGVSLNPPQLDFTVGLPGQPVGTTSGPLSVTVTNNGALAFSIHTLVISGPNSFDFSLDKTTTCKAGTTTLTNGQMCVVAADFTPSEAGERQAEIQLGLTSTLGLSIAQNVPIQGNALAQPIQLNPASLNLGQAQVGTVAAGSCALASPSCVTIQNVGTNPMTITGIGNTDTAEFQLSDSNGCANKTYQPNDTCMFSISFSPTGQGLRTDSFTIAANLSGLVNFSQTLPVAGDGLAPLVTISSPPLTFPNQQVGTTSATEIVTLSNIGTAPLNFGAPPAAVFTMPGADAADFSFDPAATSCPVFTVGGALGVSKSCAIGVKFTPRFLMPVNMARSARNATLAITDTSGGSPTAFVTQSIGTSGAATYPVVSLTMNGQPITAPLNFGGVPVTTRGSPMSFTLANVGTAPLSLYGIVDSDSAEFVESDNCPRAPAPPTIPTASQQLAVNTFCTITVTFGPSIPAGSRNATLTFMDDNLGSWNTAALTQVVNLTGTGTDFTLSVSPASITIAPSKTATYQITLNPIDGFNNPVSFSCAGGPPHSNCFISGMSNGSASVILSTSQGVNHGTFMLTFTSTYTGTAPASGTLSHFVNASITIK